MSNNYMRQLDILDPKKYGDIPITVIGAGGIGAALVVALAKSGFENITVYDFDRIEDHNLPNQLLPMFMHNPDGHEEYTLGEEKVTALSNLVWSLTGIQIFDCAERYVDQPLGEIVISAVDSLEARQEIWHQVSQSLSTDLYMDGRMALTSFDLYTIDMLQEDSVTAYEPTLEGEAEELPCTGRATMFNAFIIAGHMTALLVAHLNGWDYPWRFYYNVRSWQTLAI